MTSEDCAKLLAEMKSLSKLFATSAKLTELTPFTQFAGLMNEYVQVCERLHFNGVDFTQQTELLSLRPHEVDYIVQNLETIFRGNSFAVVSKNDSQSPETPSSEIERYRTALVRAMDRLRRNEVKEGHSGDR